VYYLIGAGQRPFTTGLRVLGYTRGMFYGTLGGALVALALGYPATRALGIDGAMLSLCLVQTAILCILAFSYRAALRAANRAAREGEVTLARMPDRTL
jgi:O-antigen/teichoic acid export membrane protein